MDTPPRTRDQHPDEADLIDAIREQLIAWLELHRSHCGHAACAEPANALAFLAHCAGLRVRDLAKFREALDLYETTCVQCPHLRN